MRERVLAEVAQRVHLLSVVVHAADKGVLVGRATPGAVHVLAHDGVEVEQRVLFHAGHQIIARLLDGGVERNGKGELFRLAGELADHGDDAASRHGEVASADAALVGVIELAERPHSVVVVHEGLALAHEDDARHASVEVIAHVHDLVVYLGSGERAREARPSRGAERAAHGAAGLRAHAHRELLAGGHADALNGGAVGKAEQVLATAVLGDLARDLLHAAEREALRELRAKGLGKVGHVIEALGVLVPDPVLDLLDAERGLPEGLHELHELALGHGFEVANGAVGSAGVSHTYSCLRVVPAVEYPLNRKLSR